MALVALGLTACSSGPGTDKSNASPVARSTAPPTALSVSTRPVALRAVTIRTCGPDAAKHVEIAGAVRNVAAHEQSFVVQLAILDRAGTKTYLTAAAAPHVAARSVGRWTARTTAHYAPGMTCQVTGLSGR